jgi:hypothetical protein
MTGLPYLAENVKSLIKWGLIGVASLFGLWVVWLFVNFGYKTFFPPPPTPPDVAFGKLRQPVVFNSSFAESLFTLDTPGRLVVTPPRLITVYEVPTIEGEFASLDTAKKTARGAGFDTDPRQISENEWLFSNARNSNKSLRLDIVSGNFIQKYDWVADPKALEGVFKTNDEAITSRAESYLSNLKVLKDDLKNGETRVTYWKITENQREQVGSFSEANAAMVEFFRQSLDEKNKIVELNPNRAQVNVWISSSPIQDKQLLELNFTYFVYSIEKTATYPPKSGTEALDEMKKGNAFIAVGKDEKFSSIVISETYIAYLNPNSDSQPMLPVYVFEGKGTVGTEKKDFVAYVPAVSSEYIR